MLNPTIRLPPQVPAAAPRAVGVRLSRLDLLFVTESCAVCVCWGVDGTCMEAEDGQKVSGNSWG